MNIYIYYGRCGMCRCADISHFKEFIHSFFHSIVNGIITSHPIHVPNSSDIITSTHATFTSCNLTCQFGVVVIYYDTILPSLPLNRPIFYYRYPPKYPPSSSLLLKSVPVSLDESTFFLRFFFRSSVPERASRSVSSLFRF